jgi:hypothetical protein
MVLLGRIELPTSALPRMRSTTELQQHTIRETTRHGAGPVRAGARYWPHPLALSSTSADSAARLIMGKETELTREQRLAAKLRENLRRRKEQARALTGDNPPLSKEDPPR